MNVSGSYVVAQSRTNVADYGVRYWTGTQWTRAKHLARGYAHACNAKGVITVNGFKDDVHIHYFVDTRVS